MESITDRRRIWVLGFNNQLFRIISELFVIELNFDTKDFATFASINREHSIVRQSTNGL